MTMDHFEKLANDVNEGIVPTKLGIIIHDFFVSYAKAVKENGYCITDLQPILKKFLELVEEQLKDPYSFSLYHQRIASPFDYYHFGLDILRPLIIFNSSKALGLDNVDTMEKVLASGENVILLANHQTEPDPQAISLLLEKTHPQFAEDMIFIAGHRVTNDPLAVPFSKGRNMICIFSKRHLDNPPEQKQEKLRYNQRAMKKLSELLSEGGKCIYVAPSGGRDRANEKGEIEVSNFDPQSIEMFRLTAQLAGVPTHFYTLALSTYHLLPPPSSIKKEIGEQRHTLSTPIHLAFGKEIDMNHFPGSDHLDKKKRRELCADFIWKQVVQDYTQLHTS